MQYSIKKGAVKGVVAGLTILVAFLAFTGLSDVTIWGLLEQYLKPVLGAATVGGVITMALNYFKVKSQK